MWITSSGPSNSRLQEFRDNDQCPGESNDHDPGCESPPKRSERGIDRTTLLAGLAEQ